MPWSKSRIGSSASIRTLLRHPSRDAEELTNRAFGLRQRDWAAAVIRQLNPGSSFEAGFDLQGVAVVIAAHPAGRVQSPGLYARRHLDACGPRRRLDAAVVIRQLNHGSSFEA